MSKESAVDFLKKLESDQDFRMRILAVTEGQNLISADRNELELQKYSIIQEAGFHFTKDELFEAAGVAPIELSPEAEEQLRNLDRQLRNLGLEGVNPLAYTAYSAGIN